MTRTKEKIKTIVHKADGTIEHTTERMGTVYKKKDGREWAHQGQGYLQVEREEGIAVIHSHPPGAVTATPPPTNTPEATAPIAAATPAVAAEVATA